MAEALGARPAWCGCCRRPRRRSHAAAIPARSPWCGGPAASQLRRAGRHALRGPERGPVAAHQRARSAACSPCRAGKTSRRAPMWAAGWTTAPASPSACSSCCSSAPLQQRNSSSRRCRSSPRAPPPRSSGRRPTRIRDQASLLDKAQDAIIVRGIDQRIVVLEQERRAAVRLDAGEALGQLGGRAGLHRPEGFRAANQAAGARRMERRDHPAAQGRQPLMVEARWTLVRDAADEPHSVLAINTDITARKAAEARSRSWPSTTR
jgi:PAS domain-containing protein